MNSISYIRRSAIIPILIGAGGLFTMSLIAYLLRTEKISTWIISPHQIVNFTFTMQMMIFPFSIIAIALVYNFDENSFKTYFRFRPSSQHRNNWNFFGPAIAVSFTIGTILFMAPGVHAQNGTINSSFVSLLPLVFLFSITNAWSEEIFSRFVIVAGLTGKLNANSICWISAIIFGLPHFAGTPGGISGVIMSGLLGWLLAKSVIETKSLGWALFIHFLQDLIIFGAGAMVIAGNLK